MPGRILTFYSYKGGVGRTMALANVAAVLAGWGYRVLCIDWDLEAPGLHLYFPELRDLSASQGLVDLVSECAAKGETADWNPFVTTLELPDNRGHLDFIPAGRMDSSYVSRLQAIDWEMLFADCGFGQILERYREEWIARYDLVLIDSRTGVTDAGGICTIHLPDTLVVLTTPNLQSLDGSRDVIERARARHDSLPFDRARLGIVPVLTRVDSRVEHGLTRRWTDLFAARFTDVLRDWTPKHLDPLHLTPHLRLPYVARWCYGEELPVLVEDVRESDSFSYALTTVAALLALGMQRVEELVTERDSYVASALRAGSRATAAPGHFDWDVFISASVSDEDLATALSSELKRRSLRVRQSGAQSRTDGGIPLALQTDLAASQHLVLICGRQDLAPWQEAELKVFLASTFDEGGRSIARRIVPLIRAGADESSLPGVLRSLSSVREVDLAMTTDRIVAALRPSDEVTSGVEALPDKILRSAHAGMRSLPTRRVYLSSTAIDLAAHRDAVADAVLRLSAVPVRMETFGSAPNLTVGECEQRVRDSDALVTIVAHRYGWVPSAEQGGRDGKSITWIEVEAALASRRPVFAFVVDDAYPWTDAKEQDRLRQPDVLADPEKIVDVARAVQSLLRFRQWLREGLSVETFTTPSDLAAKVTSALASWALAQEAISGPQAGPSPGVQLPELRIHHALQPAPHFEGRAELIDDLVRWWNDPAHPDRVRALIAPGGTGKTAVIEQVLRRARELQLRGNVLVWSFYETPDADAFLREACELFLGEREGAAGGRLERLERGLREGSRPHLLVLDGLERLQAEAREGSARGKIEDHSLRVLLRSIAAGLGRTRALITSRLPLADLDNWKRAGYGETRLDDLEPAAAVAVLHAWGVRGDDTQLAALAADVGNHALSVSALGSFLAAFGDGDPGFADRLDLRREAGDDSQAARLARLLQGYAEHLPAAERDLLVRLSVFPRGVSVKLLGVVVNAGGEVAGELVGRSEADLLRLARRLVERGLVFTYIQGAERIFTAHPFLRDWFRQLLGPGATSVHEAIRTVLAQGLNTDPAHIPKDSEELDRYEALIEHSRLAGREREAFDIYFRALGGSRNLARTLGENTRGARIVASFSESGRPEDITPALRDGERAVLLSDWALYLAELGQLEQAARIFVIAEQKIRSFADPAPLSPILTTEAKLAFLRGRLPESRDRAAEAIIQAAIVEVIAERAAAHASRAGALHALGALTEARADFAAVYALTEGERLYTLRGLQEPRHRLDLGALSSARNQTQANLEIATHSGWNSATARCHALLARVSLQESAGSAAPHLDAVRSWTAKSGDMEMAIEGHWIAADLARRRGDLQGARDETLTGLNHAEACGYGLLHIELLVLLSRLHLAWPNARVALQHARHALDLATVPECGYAWGEADAAQLCGEAHLALGEPEHARRRFEQALAVRERIEHPAVAETRTALARLADS